MFDRIADFIAYFLLPLIKEAWQWFVSDRGGAVLASLVSLFVLIGGQKDAAIVLGLFAITNAILSLRK